MFTTVVVGTDGSETAAEAVRNAIDLVKMSGGTLHLVSAYKPKQMQMRSAGGGEDFLKSLESGDVAESVLADLAHRAQLAGVTARTHTEIGAPADVICRVAEDVSADLVVVGNKGMAGAGRVLGSVPNSVAHHAPCSVLIVSTT